MPSLADLARQFLAPTLADPGIYGPETMYSPEPRNPAVPESPLETIGNILGWLGNQGRLARNAQAAAWLRAFEEAKAAGPEAVQQFLQNPNLPPWFQTLLPGISPGTFSEQVGEHRRAIIGQIRSAIKEVVDQAAEISDPAQRDAFIDSHFQELRSQYPDWAQSLFTLPRDPQGHYILPGAEKTRLERIRDIQTLVGNILTDAAKLPTAEARDAYIDKQIEAVSSEDPQLGAALRKSFQRDANGHYIVPGVDELAKSQTDFMNAFNMAQQIEAEVMRIEDPVQRAARYAQLRAEYVKRWPQYAYLLPEKVEQIAGAEVDVEAQVRKQLHLRPGDPIPSVRQWALTNAPSLIAALEARQMGYLLDQPLTVWWDSKQRRVDIAKINAEIQQHDLAAMRDTYGQGRLEMQELSNAITRLQAELHNKRARNEFIDKLHADPVKWESLGAAKRQELLKEQEENNKEIAGLESALKTLMQWQQGMLGLPMPGTGQPTPGAGGPTPTPKPPKPPSDEEVKQAVYLFRVALQTGRDPATGGSMSREKAVRELGKDWPRLTSAHKKMFLDVGLDPKEAAWLDSGMKGPYPGLGRPTPPGKPAPTPKPTPVSPADLDNPWVDNPAIRSARLLKNALETAHRFRIAAAKATPEQRRRLILDMMWPVWRDLDPKDRRTVANAAGLTKEEADWLAGGAQMISPAR